MEAANTLALHDHKENPSLGFPVLVSMIGSSSTPKQQADVPHFVIGWHTPTHRSFASTGESAIQTQEQLSPSFPQNGKTVRHLKSTADREDDSIPSDEEDRASVAGLVDRVKSLLRLNPTKMQAAKNNPKGANEAISKVNSIIGAGKTTTQLTPEKAKALEAYARSNPDKWYAMAYYINYVFGIGLVAFLLYGTFYLGWRPLGVGGPRVN